MSFSSESFAENHIDSDFGSHEHSILKDDESSSLDMEQLLLNFEENEPIFNNELLYPTPIESEIIHFKDGKLIQGTVEALVTYVTSPDVLNYQFLVDFFLTFRNYIDSLPLLELLLCRLSWCLKNSLSDDLEISSVGRLVLVRTFVTIRHWLLNHFQDDFVDNLIIRKLFTSTINEISKHERYVGNDENNIQSKIVKDLKKNYLTLCSIYWDINFDGNEKDIFHYKISAYEDMNHLRLSVMGLSQLNDPSTRRSTLLYMLENQSSTNILNESMKKPNNSPIKSSSVDKLNPLELILNKNSDFKPKGSGLKEDNYILYPKASLSALEFPKLRSSSNDSSSIDQLYSNIYMAINNKPILGFKSLNMLNCDKDIDGGFTLRGNIEVFQDSKINKIESLTKEIVTKNEKYDNNENFESKAVNKSSTKVANSNKPTNSITPNNDNNNNNNNSNDTRPKYSSHNKISKPKKRGFFKSLFGNHGNKENTHSENVKDISNSSNAKKEPLVRNKNIQQQEIFKMTKQKTKPQMNEPVYNIIEDLEKSITVDDKKIDYLEDIVIKDYQFMIQHRSFKQRYSKQIKNSNRKSVLSMGIDLGDRFYNQSFNHDYNRHSKFDPHDSPIKMKNIDYHEGQLEESINANNNSNSNFNNSDIAEKNEKSFQTPPDTIDWSDSLNMDATNDVFIDMGVSANDIDEVSILDTSSNFDNHNINRKPDSFKGIRCSLQHYGNSVRYSNIPKRQKHKSDSDVLNKTVNNFINILNNEEESHSDTSKEDISNRFSVNVIGRSSLLSNVSYMTYDSDFSSNSKGRNNFISNDFHENKLRKIGGISNLRMDKYFEVENVDDIANDIEDRNETINTAKSHDEENQILSNETSEFLNIENLRIFQELPLYNDVESANSKKSVISILPSPTPSQACYNGLSQTDINELAAIPDETTNDDPLHYTLSKLRGEGNKAKVIVGLNDVAVEDQDEIHRKHAIGIVCQSPIKNNSTLSYGIQNVINDEYSSNDEIKLEKQVRDLYIANNPNVEPVTPTRASTNSKLEMNMMSTQSYGRMRETGSVLTRMSTGKLLKEDGEKSVFDMQSLMTTPKALDSSPTFTINQVLNDKLHIPFIFKYDSEILASQMTLIERDILMEVDWKELVNLKWNQPLTPYNSWLRLLLDLSDKTGLQLITLRFNLVNNWIISEILLCKNFTLRVLSVTRFIQLAHKCRSIQNYATLFQIMLALNSEVMKRLKSTWIRVDPGTILKFKELKDLTSPNNNFKNYRNELEKIIPSKGFIPFLPLELSDLTMYSEMPTIVSSKPDVSDDINSLNDVAADDDGDLKYELVNFEKFSITGETVKKTLRFIEWSRFYDFKTDKAVISKCLYISSLSEEDMELCLKEIEP